MYLCLLPQLLSIVGCVGNVLVEVVKIENMALLLVHHKELLTKLRVFFDELGNLRLP